jgi:hypothetical protein
MNATIKFLTFLAVVCLLAYGFVPADRSGCEAYIYVANNSNFDIRLQIDGIPQTGSMLPSKVRIFPVELLNDAPKRVKVKIIYEDPDYLEPKSYVMITKTLNCGYTDSLYIGITK